MIEPRGAHLISRRGFLLSALAVGGSLVVRIPTTFSAIPSEFEIYHWVTISQENLVTIKIAQMEMGQGTTTAMSQLLGEELEVDWSKVNTEFIDLSRHIRNPKIYVRTQTAISRGVREAQQLLRKAGAIIRVLLVETAAERLRVPARELRAVNSSIIHDLTGRTLLYGELVEDAAKRIVPDPMSVSLKPVADWKLIGQPVTRLDISDKVTGTAGFGIDVVLPNMKFAAVWMCPVFGGTIRSYDASKIEARPGIVKVVKLSDGATIAVVADDWWLANRTVGEMDDTNLIEWDGGTASTVTSASIFTNLHAGLDEKTNDILRNDGNVDTALASSMKQMEEEYFVPYLEHATMEPMNCTAVVTDEAFEVWAPTQVPEKAFEAASVAAGMRIDKGRFHMTLIGGGFGRRQKTDSVTQAVEIAKAVKGTPVKLVWSRENTMRHGWYRPTSVSRIAGALDKNGEVTAWSHRIVAHSNNPVFSSYGADSLLYAIPNVRVDRVTKKSHVPEAPMRGISFSMNCFVTQSFVDELAIAAGIDTYRFQRNLIDPNRTPNIVPQGQLLDNLVPSERAARMRAVLDEVAAKAHWDKPLGPQRGRGIAIDEEANGYFAAVVEVTLSNNKEYTIDRVVIAADPGFLVNPSSANAQVEGSVAFGLTSAHYGEITIDEGSVLEGNFDEYPLLRINEMPPVEIHWVLSQQYWGGVGEPIATVVIPALTNAIHNAGGPRIRSLPIKKHLSLRPAGED